MWCLHLGGLSVLPHASLNTEGMLIHSSRSSLSLSLLGMSSR